MYKNMVYLSQGSGEVDRSEKCIHFEKPGSCRCECQCLLMLSLSLEAAHVGTVHRSCTKPDHMVRIT